MATAGRPSKYTKDTARQAEKLCGLGATDEQLADFFDVSVQTLNTWKKEHPEFLESLKRGKDDPDEQVEQSLFHRATGYSHPAVKIFCNKDGEVTEVPYTEYYPPDTTACIFWLKNRRKERWREKQETDPGGTEEPTTALNYKANPEPIEPSKMPDGA